MSDTYGYIGIETLLEFCRNNKNHCVTPNDFMRMNWIKIDELPSAQPEIIRCCQCKYAEVSDTLCGVIGVIKGEKTIERPHGEWIEKPSYTEDRELGIDKQVVCSRCDEQNSHYVYGKDGQIEGKMFVRSKFCPNCGAPMNEEAFRKYNGLKEGDEK